MKILNKLVLTFSIFGAGLYQMVSAQAIPTTITVSPSTTHAFEIQKSNLSLNPVSSSPANGNELYNYAAAISPFNFKATYIRYKFTHSGIANSDITNITYSFGSAPHIEVGKPPTYWAYSQMYVVSPQNSCNGYWNSYVLNDCVSIENCIRNGAYVLAGYSPAGNTSTSTWQQSISASTNPNLNALLLNPDDFTIAFMPDNNCYLDLKTPISVQITYNVYPIANNTICCAQTFTGSGNPAIINGSTPTGGNRGTYSYQWQSSINNTTWANISGATGKNYDPPVILQTTYYRRIVNSSPAAPSTSASVMITVNPPLTPTGLVATPVSASVINLSWNASNGAGNYEIYLCNGNYAIGAISGLTYSVTGLNANTNYSFKIFASSNYSGNSAFTNCVSATTFPPIPATPTGLTATAASSSTINLSWSASAYATSYNIYSCAGAFISSTSATSFSVTGLSSNTNYSYKVSASGTSGISAFTTCASATTFPPPIPATPTGLTATPISSSQINLNWNAPTYATNYHIYDCNNNAIGTSATTSYSVTGLLPNTNYSYKVRAYNISGKSAFTACVSATTPYAPCPVNAGVDKTNATSDGCCVNPCSSVQIGTVSFGYIYNWTPCNGTLSSCTIAQPVAKPCSTTNYTLTVSGSGCATSSDVVKITTNAVVVCCGPGGKFAANPMQEEKTIKIFPNPSDGKILVEAGEQIQAISITDVMGRIAYYKNNIASNRHFIDLSQKSRGIYFVKITQQGREYFDKIVIE